jgi:hypothetical protein
MRVRVTSIEPKPVVDERDVGSGPRRSAPTEDLGPAGEAVRALIDRAAHLSPQHRRRLADEERWRAWPISLTPAGGLAAVRASAYAYARQAGLPHLPVILAKAVQEAVGEHAGDRDLRQAVADAALAVALADVLPEDIRERLQAAWRTALG